MMTPAATALLLAATAGLSEVGHAWTPAVGDTWNYNLNSPVDTTVGVDVVFIDMDGAQDTIDALHDNGKVVVCYISIGTVEDWGDDFEDFPAEAMGNDMDGWEGEKWLDVTNLEVRTIMDARVEKAASMNCDAIEPDNMSVYSEENTGVDVSRTEQIQYNSWFSTTVHAHGMLVGLKNVVDLIPNLVSYFDFAINESCHVYDDECDVYVDTFLAAGKPVFNVECIDNMDVCVESNAMGFDTIIKDYSLNAPFCSCADSSRSLDCDSVL